jgi:hypothetical protein
VDVAPQVPFFRWLDADPRGAHAGMITSAEYAANCCMMKRLQQTRTSEKYHFFATPECNGRRRHLLQTESSTMVALCSAAFALIISSSDAVL